MDNGSILSVIQQIKDEYPELGERVRRAAGLFQSGAVCYLGGNEWRCFSQSNGAESYTVRFNLKWTCTCPDCEHGAPEIEFYGGTQKTCKHIIAAAMSWQIDSEEACEFSHPQPSITIPGWLVEVTE